MIRKKPAPDLIRGENRFSEKIMRHQKMAPEAAPFSSQPVERDKLQFVLDPQALAMRAPNTPSF